MIAMPGETRFSDIELVADSTAVPAPCKYECWRCGASPHHRL